MIPMVVLAGGLATRLGHLTETTPKSLISISGRPFVDWQLDLIEKAGIGEVYFLLSHLSERIINHLETKMNSKLKFHYLLDGVEPAGTGGALIRNFAQLPKEFFLMYGDSYLQLDYASVHKSFVESGADYLMTICKTPENGVAQSNVEFEDGKVKAYSKNHKTPGMHFEDFGLSILKKEVLRSYLGEAKCDLSKITSELASHGRVSAFLVNGKYFEVGSSRGIADIQHYLEGQNVQ